MVKGGVDERVTRTHQRTGAVLPTGGVEGSSCEQGGILILDQTMCLTARDKYDLR